MTITIHNDLYRFLREHGNNRVKRELLLFWGMHPRAKFNKFTICYAIDSSKLDMTRALKDMIAEGLVETHAGNIEPLYSLTTDEERRRPVLELAAIGWDGYQLMLKRMEQEINEAPAIVDKRR
jgi:hypothetical protein